MCACADRCTGAGAAGSSAAYHLSQDANDLGLNVNITIFEKENRIGGRTLTINPYGDSSQVVELGASIFVQINQILYSAAQQFDLVTVGQGSDSGVENHLGVWDGDKFVFTLDERLPEWFNKLKVALRYGVAPPKQTRQLVASVTGQFLQIYQPPHFPFSSLTDVVANLGLTNVTGVSGEQFLNANGVSVIGGLLSFNNPRLTLHRLAPCGSTTFSEPLLGLIMPLTLLTSMAWMPWYV